jgi:hypothetical protein
MADSAEAERPRLGSGPCAAALGLGGFDSNQVHLEGVQKHKGAVNNAEEWFQCNVRPVLARPCRRMPASGAPPSLPQDPLGRSERPVTDRNADGQEGSRGDRNDAPG